MKNNEDCDIIYIINKLSSTLKMLATSEQSITPGEMGDIGPCNIDGPHIPAGPWMRWRRGGGSGGRGGGGGGRGGGGGGEGQEGEIVRDRPFGPTVRGSD